MKGQKLHEVQEKYTINGFCLVCGEGFQFPYGRWHVEGKLQSGTCCGRCEREQEKRHAALLQAQIAKAEYELPRVLRGGLSVEVQPRANAVTP